ncbi:hypothetical protein C0995_010889 [Termitomyces sp. Mi166|nr:hypothetical protein C0995_010889 [Termitomyces sp. Mi166\
MGQRHQAFLIAEIVPHGKTDAKYRCVAAMHHQWCYGSLPLRATRRLLTLLKKPEHEKIILQELRALDGKYGRWRAPPKTPQVPCPFSSFLMVSSFNIDLSINSEEQEPYVSGVSIEHALLDANMGSSEGDNNDGITVIDITDPRNPAYCFVFLGQMIPLTANDYIRNYYQLPKSGKLKDSGEMILSVIAALEGERLVTLQMLVEAWPEEYKESLGKQINDQSTEPELGPIAPDSLVPLLSDLALKPTVEHALETGDTKDIEQLVWLPGKAEAIIGILKAHEPFPDSGVSLLAQAFKNLNRGSIDLSAFSMSTIQIISVMANVSNVQILDLSHNPLVTGDTIRAILESIPTLKRLVLLDTSVTDEALSSLFRDHQKLFFNLEALTHPLLLNGRSSRFPNAFAIIVYDQMMHFVTTASIPFFTPSFIVQALTDYLRAALHVVFFNSFTSTIAPQVAFSSTIRKDTETWANRTVPMVASFFRYRALSGEGWIFGLDTSVTSNSYGFIETKPDNIDTSERMTSEGPATNKELDRVKRVIDLREFLAEMESEGRPSAPPPAVEELCTILDQLKAPASDRPFASVFKLMDISEANDFIKRSYFGFTSPLTF